MSACFSAIVARDSVREFLFRRGLFGGLARFGFFCRVFGFFRHRSGELFFCNRRREQRNDEQQDQKERQDLFQFSFHYISSDDEFDL